MQALCSHSSPMYSPAFDQAGEAFAVSSCGSVIKFVDGEPETLGGTNGQPTAIAFNGEGECFVADVSHKVIFKMQVTSDALHLTPHVSQYEGSPLLGPAALAFDGEGGLFFTDGGALGESSLARPTGSLFYVSPTTQLLVPVSLRNLASPAGVCCAPGGGVVFVAETLQNRVLRFVQAPGGAWHGSVFCRLSGRLGPTAVACHGRDLFIAHYDFPSASDDGRVLVVDNDGEVSAVLAVPGAPAITGLAVTPDGTALLVTEETSRSIFRTAL